MVGLEGFGVADGFNVDGAGLGLWKGLVVGWLVGTRDGRLLGCRVGSVLG